MNYIRFFFVLYWFPHFLKFGSLPSENPRCAPEVDNEKIIKVTNIDCLILQSSQEIKINLVALHH